ncbi:wall-associated receptor kinase-like 22 [Chenopodium quinoa]|uniref:wall-associated receptor kinase-like 22 n=1 Tax=Chenopodium quinoa TaxID=63459 RepID=UPI000B76D00D|nr:wall-associated receptor kinase-like 22 [Chenopodium quinoa]
MEVVGGYIEDEDWEQEKIDFRFTQNGGILLEKQIALSQGRNVGPGQLKILSHKDIEKATNNLDPNLLVGSSAQRNVYKATIEDRIVVVGVPLQLERNPKLVDRNLNEASIAMVMNHENMVKLYGCCLDTFIPILVYEMLPNGILSQHLHGDTASIKCLKWADRLRVATDTAYALSYMHNALRKPVVHRGVSSASVLLDSSFQAKLGNFGYAVSINPGDTSERWSVEGSPGFIDPEYIETQVVTDKCDVYSFGVLLLELLTRSNPIRMLRGGRDLVDVFVSAFQNNCVMNMIDRELLNQASRDEIKQAVRIALKCVAKKGAERPTMIEVVVQLRQIRDTCGGRGNNRVQGNLEHARGAGNLDQQQGGESSQVQPQAQTQSN